MCNTTYPKAKLGNDPPSADEDVAKLRLQRSDLSLSELEQKGLVSWNRDEHIVTKGPHLDEKRPNLEDD
jgi:hypothetical protein